MEQRTVSPPEWPQLVRSLTESGQPSEAPIYDAVERQWLAQGRTVPRRPSRPRNSTVPPANDEDLFHRG
ncbi:hypothetical protein GCM10010347_26100 [Streptomyces cirratus]|uniref:Transposase n=1 Tax=Streptomyces cirratus TaxID=68187 RepID=A0ABQ3ERH1_9ACTN|nr:hypothetical protein [Streptomyces cirratus]GHB54995.1 hypothetical protein GCM10010347_26100 [Streptomyces cirratus]